MRLGNGTSWSQLKYRQKLVAIAVPGSLAIATNHLKLKSCTIRRDKLPITGISTG